MKTRKSGFLVQCYRSSELTWRGQNYVANEFCHLSMAPTCSPRRVLKLKYENSRQKSRFDHVMVDLVFSPPLYGMLPCAVFDCFGPPPCPKSTLEHFLHRFGVVMARDNSNEASTASEYFFLTPDGLFLPTDLHSGTPEFTLNHFWAPCFGVNKT